MSKVLSIQTIVGDSYTDGGVSPKRVTEVRVAVRCKDDVLDSKVEAFSITNERDASAVIAALSYAFMESPFRERVRYSRDSIE